MTVKEKNCGALYADKQASESEANVDPYEIIAGLRETVNHYAEQARAANEIVRTMEKERDAFALSLRRVLTDGMPNYSMLTHEGRVAEDEARKLLEQFARAALKKVQP